VALIAVYARNGKKPEKPKNDILTVIFEPGLLTGAL
jgi:hypothetical protein